MEAGKACLGGATPLLANPGKEKSAMRQEAFPRAWRKRVGGRSGQSSQPDSVLQKGEVGVRGIRFVLGFIRF